MKLRKCVWWLVIAITLIAMFASAWSRAYVTTFVLIVALVFAVWHSRNPVPEASDLNDWFIALEGKDPFNPDVKPIYEWQGFATTLVAALRVANHPTLAGKTLLVFRDETDAEAWRGLVTRIRHGAHTLHRNRKWFVWF